MGYDMQWQKDGEREGYFRSNIWGMAPLRAAMLLAGAADGEASFPKFPKPEYGDEEVAETDPRHVAHQAACDAVRATPGPDGKVPLFKFCSNDGWIVTPAEAKLIAEKLTAWLAVHPGDAVFARSSWNGTECKLDGDDGWRSFVQEFADYNRKCAEAETAYQVW